MENETHDKADRLRKKIENASKHIEQIKTIVQKIESYEGEEGNYSFVGIYNENVRIGKDNALIILQVHRAQSEIELAKLVVEYSEL